VIFGCTTEGSVLGIAREDGTGEDDDGQSLEMWLLVQPSEDFKAGNDGHFKVEQEKAGKGELRAVGKWWAAGEVVDAFLAVWNVDELVVWNGLLKGFADEENIVWVIFGQEDG
jgi:hypothetical protein